MTDKHYSSQFEHELQVASAQLIELGQRVEAQISQTIVALTRFDIDGARTVLEAEAQVNELEALIDQEVTSIIARRQPAARDLRLVMAISKASGSLERVGNEAERMARRVLALIHRNPLHAVLSPELRAAADLSTGLLRKALDAFSRLDTAQALAVMKEDDPGHKEVDALVSHLVQRMIDVPQTITLSVELISIAKSLELIVDHAKHIAELVIYVAQGADVRHTPVEQIESLIA